MKKICYKVERLFLKIGRKVYKAINKKKRYNHTTIADNQVSDYIKELLLTDKPCMVGRFGCTEFDATYFPYVLKQSLFNRYKFFIQGYIPTIRDNQNLRQKYVDVISFFSGFFPNKPELINTFSDLMVDSMQQVDLLGVVPWNKEDLFAKEYHKRCVFSKYDTIEPYDYEHPWSKALEGKKVLVIHPFAKTIEMQYQKRALLFENRDILPEFELKTIKAVQTIAGESAEYESWFDALAFMQRQIDAIDFDIAIIGCGAYGFPLAAYVKQIGKKGIHLGGATQFLFGIKGKRWEDIPEMAAMMNEHWVRPLPEETPQQNKKVEGGCYW